MKKSLFLLLCGFLLLSANAHASPANCDDDMTAEQREAADICSWNIFCGFVYKIQESCVKIKSFLSKLAKSSKGNKQKFTDDQISEAMAETYQVPRSTLGACLRDLDLDKCRELLNGGPKKPDAEQQAVEISQHLTNMIIGTKSEKWGLEVHKRNLKSCETATSETSNQPHEQAEKKCGFAKNSIELCLTSKARYDEQRAALQRIVDSGALTNKIYQNLANKPYPECPTTLPSSGKTPQAALADYLKWWDRKDESKDADMEKESIALPRRGSTAGTSSFQAALSQPSYEKRELSDQERAAIAQQQGSLMPALGALQSYLDAQAAAERQRMIQQQADQQRRIQEQQQAYLAQSQQRIREQEALARGREENIARAQARNREAESATGKPAYLQEQERRVAADIERSKEIDERLRVENERRLKEIEAIKKAKEEEDKYYSPLRCVVPTIKRYSSSNNTYRCLQNNCGRPVEGHGDSGMWTIGTGACLSGSFEIACEKNDMFVKERGLCKRW